MREIKFRGKKIKDNLWEYGCLVMVNNERGIYYPCIVNSSGENSFTWDEVDEETVGQYTGLKDKNGLDIYEGDIIRFNGVEQDDYYENEICVVSIVDGCIIPFYEMTGQSSGVLYTTELYYDSVNIIGNKFENPELLK